MLDKENAAARKGVFMIDASKGFRKDGPKNSLRDQDIHRIVDTFSRQDESDPRYARVVPVEEIADPKNDFNLNLPRYIDSSEPEDIQDIDGHLRGGIPERDLDALGDYWRIMPALRAALFEPLRPGYYQLKTPIAEVKPAILGHPEFVAFNDGATKLFEAWKAANMPRLKGFAKDGHPKALIETLSESLLSDFKTAPLLDAYDVYQHLMDYWTKTMQDDTYLIAAVGWKEGASPREIRQVKEQGRQARLAGEGRFSSRQATVQVRPRPGGALFDRYFAGERDAIAALEVRTRRHRQELEEMREEQGGEDGLLAEANEANEGEPPKITAKSVKDALRRIGNDRRRGRRAPGAQGLPRPARQAGGRQGAAQGCGGRPRSQGRRQISQTDRDRDQDAGGGRQMARRAGRRRAGRTRPRLANLTGRIRQLAERYASPLPQLADEVAALAARVDGHLKKMGASWA